MALSILINGSRGRMGHALAEAARELGLTVGAAVDAGDDLAAGLAKCDVIVDFSSHQATQAVLELAVARRKPVVIGTTGHSADGQKERSSRSPRKCRASGRAIFPSG